MYRKLNPLPQPPVRPRTEYLGPNAGPLEDNANSSQAETTETKEETPPAANERSQVETAWAPMGERPTKPLTRSVGSVYETNAFSDQTEPPY